MQLGAAMFAAAAMPSSASAAAGEFPRLPAEGSLALFRQERAPAGGDFALMRDFLRAVDTRNPAKLTSSIEESIESHFMGFACEESRLKGVKADMGNCLGF